MRGDSPAPCDHSVSCAFTSQGQSDTGARRVRIQAYNRVLDELQAIPGNDATLDIPDLYAWPETDYDKKYDDGIHPNGLGYQSVADESFRMIP